jgi:CDP-4-dehydro-6-deoxyglucose reductase
VSVISSQNIGSFLDKSYVQNYAINDQLDLEHTTVYACGSESMIKDARRLLVENGLDSKHFFSDAFISSS